MIFILLTFLSAFTLETIGTIISIIGLTSMFGMSYLIISMAIAFDFGKIISVSFLYREWKHLNFLLKTYLTIATLVLMLITSVGVLGFLSASFQSSILPVSEANIKTSLLEKEKEKLEARKIQIDNQIAQLPPKVVNGRSKLIVNFKTEIDHLNSRLIVIDNELPTLKISQINKTSHAGPITYIATILDTSAEKAMSIFIFIILGVFDPLAVSLILAGNYLIERRKILRELEPVRDILVRELVKSVKEPVVEEPVIEELPVVEEPVIEELPVIEEPVIEELPVTEEPVIEEPVIEEPVVEELPVNEEVKEFYKDTEELEEVVEEPPQTEKELPESSLNYIVHDVADIELSKDTPSIIGFYH